ncbi:MAG: Ig-like domain-containing protein, partial [Aquisalinus sp.]|nr:Ig-like domain-containing protein [Aquisalinus sp.]
MADQPIITSFADDTGFASDDGITNDNTPTFSGTGTPGQFIVIFLTQNGSALNAGAPVEVNTNGDWVYTVPLGNPIVDGTHTFTAIAYDSASDAMSHTNPSVSAAPITFTIDTAAPTVTDIVVNDTLLTEADLGDDAFTIAITYSEDMDTSSSPVIAFSPLNNYGLNLDTAASGWSVDGRTYTAVYDFADEDINVGNIGFSINGARDVAGNVQGTAVSEPEDRFEVDTSAPDAPTVTVLEDANNDGFINSGEPTPGNAVTVRVDFSGTGAVEGDTITLTSSTDSPSAAINSANAAAGFRDFFLTLPAEGAEHTISATITDQNGNTGPAGTDSYTLDTTRPTIDTIAFSDTVISETDTGTDAVTLSITFGEAMDTDVDPTIATNAETTLTNGEGAWTSSTVYTVTYDVADVDFERAEILVSVSGAQDVAGNTMEPFVAQPSGTSIDTLAPTISIDTIDGEAVSDPAVINATEASDGIVVAGSSTNAEAGQTVTLTFPGSAAASYTTTIDGNGDWSISLAQNEFPGDGAFTLTANISDQAGNAAAPASATFDLDTTADAGDDLSVTFNDGDSFINDGEKTTVSLTVAGLDADAAGTIIISSDGGGSLAPISVTENGEVTDIDVSSLGDGTLTATLDITDDAGNTDSASDTSTLDTDFPTVTITDDESGVATISGGDVVYTFTFSEPVFGFTADDINVSGGEKGAFIGVDGGSVYTLTVSPDANFEGNLTVNVAADAATDAAGNGNVAADESVQVVDTLAPTATVAIDDSKIITGETAQVTITFSQEIDPATLELDDFEAGNGVLSDLATSDNITFTATFTPDAGVEDLTNVITLTADSYADANGNTGPAASTDNYEVLTGPVQLFDTDGVTLLAGYNLLASAITAAAEGQTIRLGGDGQDADYTGDTAEVTVNNLTISGTAANPAITGVSATLADGVTGFSFDGDMSTSVTGGDTGTVIQGGDGDDVLGGGDGADILEGGAGSDTFNGGAGTDLARIADNADGDGDPVPFDSDDFTFVITSITDGAFTGTVGNDGDTETLSGIEVIEITNTGSSTFTVFEGMSIQAAVDMAAAGDVIALLEDDDPAVGDNAADFSGQTVTIGTDNLTITGTAANPAITGVSVTLDTGVTTFTYAGDMDADVVGSSDANTITGNDGANVIEGGEGDDTLEGGAGTDTAVYTGALDLGTTVGFDGFAVTQNMDGSYTVTDINMADGDEGTDTLTNIEQISFAGVLFDIDTLPPLVVNANLAGFADPDFAGDITEAAEGSTPPNPAEGDTLTDSGVIEFTDSELNDVHSIQTGPANGGAGFVGLFQAGISDPATGDGAGAVTWTFQVNDADIDGLRAGQELVQDYDITVSDNGTPSQSFTVRVTVTITGTNDQPVIASNSYIVATDAGEAADTTGTPQTLTASGSIQVTDSDTGDAGGTVADGDTLTASVVGTSATTVLLSNGLDPAIDVSGEVQAALIAAGNLVFTNTQIADGTEQDINFTFTATDVDIDFIPEGETLSITYSVVVNDGVEDSESQDVTITIAGTNDQPVVQAITVAANEDGGAVDPVNFVGADADRGDALTYTIVTDLAETGEGSVTNNGDGTFTYDPGTDFQDLRHGETRDVTFTYQATDDSGAANATSATATVTITVTGENDRPTVADIMVSATEDGGAVDPVNFQGTDADTNDTLTYQIVNNLGAGEGSVMNNDDGTFTFDPGMDFQDLALGETRIVTFTYTAQDDSGQADALSQEATVSIEVTGTNDAPVIAVEGTDTASAEIDETNAALRTAGTLS